ncbi:iron-containing redox enzyme family protein [Nannocystis radixulma]|uniref:Iron-containing redox enzyme family protein n=1 Tax=Nannocystis radixulma TaxID=2995305 RepID=A0ABT5B8X2_9BACT|nr:iron-containing redox enzyme family protein [Nannocystis radixulma]MDC0670579.1 iron-containing redox enzyme family protein [Nannocystis radixulma]
MTTPGARLRAKLELAQPFLAAQAEQIWTSPQVRTLYPAYLCTMHMIVRSAVPLMDQAIARAHALGPDDPLATAFAAYLERHVKEEAGHDEWLLEDLAATGSDPTVPLRQIPSPRIASLVGAQYYWLQHHHPIALLGHIAAIESYPPPPGFAERLRERTGYPRDAFRAIARHEVLDIRHRRDLYETIDALPLRPEHEKVVGLSALHTLQAGIEVLAELHENIVRAA